MYGISGEVFFQNFNTFICFENDLTVIFGFLTPKCTTINFQDPHQEGEREGLWSKLLITISQKIFEIEA